PHAMKPSQAFSTFALSLLLGNSTSFAETMSHPPQRPLPKVSQRPLPSGGDIRIVDAARGNDANAGTEKSPWKTLAHAQSQLAQGGTIVLRGGVYREHPVIRVTADKTHPLVMRSWPGELVVIDGGIAELEENLGASWEPDTAGAPDEYRS